MGQLNSAIFFYNYGMTQLIFALLCMCSIAQLSVAQASRTDTTSPCTIKEVLNHAGWEIPALAGAKLKAHARYKGAGIPEDVFVDIIESQSPEASFTYVGLRSCETAVLTIRPVDVTRIEQFTMNDHIFGYLVTGTLVGVDTQGHRIQAASEEIVYYYDPDGSGKFKIMKYAGALNFKIVIPDWAKQAPSPSKTRR